MRRRTRSIFAVAALALLVPTTVAEAGGNHAEHGDASHGYSNHGYANHGYYRHRAPTVRFATFNASMNRRNAGDLGAELAVPGSAQPDVIATIIQKARPDVLLLNEFDYDPQALADFQRNYLEVPHGDAEPIYYEYSFIAPSNTGEPSGFDYDNNGSVGGPGDAYGFGFFPGQFGMAVLSKYPIDHWRLRTFQNFRWVDMPGALLPDDPDTPEPGDYYTPGPELDSFRLSSKSHWDIPIWIEGYLVHFLASHPTPPVFDDPEIDWNGRRNHDEIRFWADYTSGRKKDSKYIYDDNGYYGGLSRRANFVIAGDLNADPFDGDSLAGAAQQVLDHPRVNTKVTPSSAGGPEQALLQGLDNETHLGDPAFDTADFGESPFGPGNLRVDYVLPSKRMKIRDAGVFWPLADDPDFALVGIFGDPVPFGFPSSDHRLVWVDARPRRAGY